MVVSGAIELLVHACSSQDRAIRLAGQENLYKLIKVQCHHMYSVCHCHLCKDIGVCVCMYMDDMLAFVPTGTAIL